LKLVRDKETVVIDQMTGEELSRTKESTSVSFKRENNKSEKFAFLFIGRASALLGLSEQQAKLLFAMIAIMDADNVAVFTPSSKSEIMQKISTKGISATKNTSIRRMAGIMFSSAASVLVKNGFINKIDPNKFVVTPSLVAFGYEGIDKIKGDRQKFMDFRATLNLEDGDVNVEIK